jgi:hypothetical protein
MVRQRVARRVLPAIAALLPLLGAGPAEPFLPQPVGAPAPRASVTEDIALARDAALTLEARAAAVRRLVASTDPAALQGLVGFLGPESRGTEIQTAVVRELGAAGTISATFLPLLESRLKESTPERHASFFRAISSVRTRDAARLLLSYVTPSTSADNRDALFQCLTRLSGRTDLGADRDAWEQWLVGASMLSDEEWRACITSSIAARADALRVQRDDALRRLTETERARVLNAPDVPTRSALLAALLHDELPALRRLGVELVNRELANARELGPEVGTATLDLLGDPSAEVRSSAADLIDRLVPNGASFALRNALAREQNPNVLAKLLRLVRRFPDVAPPELLIGWLGADTAVRRAAIDAVAAMQANGLIDSPVDLERALRTLRSEELEALSLDGLKLLCELGEEKDRQNVAAMLASPSADVRLRAAQALAPFPDRLDAIIAAAKADPTLFSVAAATLTKNRPTYEGFTILEQLSAPSPAAKTEAVNALCQRLSLADLVRAAADVSEADVRESLLARVVNLTVPDPTDPARDPFKEPDAPDLIEALFALARVQLELTRPGAALGTLDLLPAADPALARRTTPLKVQALLYLDQMDEALELPASADAWLDGMAYAVNLPHALAIGAEIDYRFGADMSTTQRARLEELTRTARAPRTPRPPRAQRD